MPAPPSLRPPLWQAPVPLQHCAAVRRTAGAVRHGSPTRTIAPSNECQSKPAFCLPPIAIYLRIPCSETVPSQPYSLTMCLNRIDFVSKPVVSRQSVSRMCVLPQQCWTLSLPNRGSVASASVNSRYGCKTHYAPPLGPKKHDGPPKRTVLYRQAGYRLA